MKNIFIASKGKGNYKEKIFSWILAFSLVVQNAAILPQMAYASESKDDSTTTAVIGESSTQESEDTSSDTHGDDNSSVDNLSRDDRNENNSDDADEDSKGQNEEGVDSDDDSDNKGHDAENVETLTTLFFALGGTSHGDDVHDNNVSSDDDSGNKGHGDDADDNNDSSDDDSDNKGHVDGDHVETLTTLVVALGGTGAHHDDDNDDDDVCDDDSDDHDSLDGNHDDDMDHNDDHSDSHHHNHGTSTSDDHESQDDHDDNSTNDHDDADGTPCVPPVVPPTTDLSVCPFEASATNYVISYGTGKKLVSNSTHADANVVKSTNIPAGTYEVSLHSYDSYDARTSVLQKNEQWYLRFNNLTTLIGISPSIGDLADNMKTATRTQYVGDVTVGQTITSAMAKHTAWSNTESNNDVYPICAQLKLKQVGQPQNTKPVITVVGANPRTVTVGSVYVDQSATVADQEDGNITNKLVTINTVNTSVVGTYTITYNATDTQNLSADAKTRTVNVVAPLACAAPLDVMIVLDRSGSMNDDGTNPEQPLTQAKQGANVFIDTLSPATDRVGVVTYSQFATLDSSLSSNFGSVKSTYASVSANGTTNIAAAIDEASSQIGTNGRSGAKHVIVLLSDGVPNVTGISLASATAQTLASAVTAKSNGTIIYTIGLGSDVNPALMQQIASAPSNYFFAPSGAQLEGVYKAISTIECQRVPATVSGMKVNDTNANGTKDAGELGIAGWQITLQEVGSTVIVTKTTGADGSYTFPDVTSGNYKLAKLQRMVGTRHSQEPAVATRSISIAGQSSQARIS